MAAPSDAQRLRAARTHYENAISHYNLDEIEAALEEFREAYRFKPDPSFLFNIAQCYRKLGQRDAAIDFYRKYVRASPDATNRAEAERRIAELKAQGEAAAAAPVGDSPPAGAPVAVAAPIDLAASPPASSSPVAPPAISPGVEPVAESWTCAGCVSGLLPTLVVLGGRERVGRRCDHRGHHPELTGADSLRGNHSTGHRARSDQLTCAPHSGT